MMTDSLLSAFHSSVDFMATAIFAVLLLKLAMVVEKALNVKNRELSRTRNRGHFVVETTRAKPCTSNPSVGDVLRIHFSYCNRTVLSVPNEDTENATRFGMDDLEVLTRAVQDALGVRCYCC